MLSIKFFSKKSQEKYNFNNRTSYFYLEKNKILKWIINYYRCKMSNDTIISSYDVFIVQKIISYLTPLNKYLKSNYTFFKNNILFF